MESELESDELRHNFLCFCSFVCILNGKKINLPNVLILVLKSSIYRNILMRLLSMDSEYSLFKYFISYEPSLAKSKYVSKFLNSKDGVKVLENYGNVKTDIQQPSYRIKKSKKKTVSS